MKLLGVLWNSLEEHYSDVLNDIKQYASIDKIYTVDFGDEFRDFIIELYPFAPEELWKAEYKIEGLINKYKDNVIRIVIMDMPRTDKVFLPNKNKDMYSNVLELKVLIRHKYRHLLKPNALDNGKKAKYDNVFHMTDDELEYNENLLSIIPFLIRFSNNDSLFELSDLVSTDDIKIEKSGTRNTFWLTPNLLFKEETEGTYESYSELFNMYLMKELGLFNSCYYGLASFNGKKGVVTQNLANENEKMYSGTEIFNGYGIYDKKELIYYNTLELLPIIIRKFCFEHNYLYDEAIEKEFEKLFIYDSITMQADRNPSNWALICDEKTRKIKLSYFDNSNMLIFDDKNAIASFRRGELDLLNYINSNISTFMIMDSSDIEMCFSSKMNHTEKFLKNADKEQLYLFFNMLNKITPELITEIINQMEYENNCVLPEDFKLALFKGFAFNKWQIEECYRRINKDRTKALCKKN